MLSKRLQSYDLLIPNHNFPFLISKYDIFINTERFSNYNNYLKNRFLQNYGPMAETAGHISFFLFAQEQPVKSTSKSLIPS